MFPFFKVQNNYVLKYDIRKVQDILTEIVNTRHTSSLYSIYGIVSENQEEYLFWAKKSYRAPLFTKSGGAKITVNLTAINGQTKLTAAVSTNPVFWLLLIMTFFCLIFAFMQDRERNLMLAVSFLIAIITIGLDRLNKKMLLSLLERYI